MQILTFVSVGKLECRHLNTNHNGRRSAGWSRQLGQLGLLDVLAKMPLREYPGAKKSYQCLRIGLGVLEISARSAKYSSWCILKGYMGRRNRCRGGGEYSSGETLGVYNCRFICIGRPKYEYVLTKANGLANHIWAKQGLVAEDPRLAKG